MSKLLINIWLLYSLSACDAIAVEIPEKFVGEWSIAVEKQSGFPWWEQIKYPVKLSVTKIGITFEDQMGFKCTPNKFFYDDELDALIFKNCLPAKSELAFSPFYRVKFDRGRLTGETWTYKLLYLWKGEAEES